MRLFWNPYSLPELRDLPKQQREQIWQNAQKKAEKRWEGLVAMLVLIAALVAAGKFVDYLKHPLFPRPLWFAVALVGIYLMFMYWQVCFVRPFIWEQIEGLCPRCGYDTRATSQRCPECGHNYNN